MSSKDIPDEVIRLVTHHIDSVEQVNILALLFSNPQRTWTLIEISDELRSSESSVQRRLEALYRAQILEQRASLEGKHGFTPATKDIASAIAGLVSVFRSSPYRIIDLIYSKPVDALRTFSDAFKLRRDDK